MLFNSGDIIFHYQHFHKRPLISTDIVYIKLTNLNNRLLFSPELKLKGTAFPGFAGQPDLTVMGFDICLATEPSHYPGETFAGPARPVIWLKKTGLLVGRDADTVVPDLKQDRFRSSASPEKDFAARLADLLALESKLTKTCSSLDGSTSKWVDGHAARKSTLVCADRWSPLKQSSRHQQIIQIHRLQIEFKSASGISGHIQ